jgi:uncharacterized membrane protein AbrB (regulator of aidB expression)
MGIFFDYGLMVAGACVVLFVLISIIGAVLEKRMTKEDFEKAGGFAIKIYFTLFVILGLSLVPVMIGIIFGFVNDFLQVDASGLELPLVLFFWGLYIVGLAIAYPVMKKGGFFRMGR